MNGLRSSGEETWDWAGLVYWRQKTKARIPCWRVWALFSKQWGVLRGFSAVECCKVFFWWMRLREKGALKEANMEEQRNVNKARLCWELGEGQAQADGYLGNAQGTLWRPKGTKAVVMKACGRGCSSAGGDDSCGPRLPPRSRRQALFWSQPGGCPWESSDIREEKLETSFVRVTCPQQPMNHDLWTNHSR